MSLEGVIRKMKDTLFPIFCVGCNVEGTFCCRECLNKFKANKIIEIDFETNKQERAVYLDKLTALFNYKKYEDIQELIHLFKYEYCEELSSVWQELYQNLFDFKFDYDLIIPVPLHSRRKRERGFNQSEVLSLALLDGFKKRGSRTGINIKDLKRTRYTSQQIHLSGKDREKNLKDVFVWVGDSLEEKTILLIDDVYTTGATLNESAKVLKNRGSKRVDCLVLAKD